MPRGIRARARIHVKTTPPRLLTKRATPINGKGPRLWNAKRRIQTSKGLDPRAASIMVNENYLRIDQWPGHEVWKPLLENKRIQMKWWKLDRETLPQFIEAHPKLRTLSQDVKDFIQKGSVNLNKSNVQRILSNPSRYFSIQHHVPLSMRKQVYFPHPQESVVLMRTPHLGARYAAFDVPRHFNKLDLKAYLKDVYDVDVLHIRSAVFQHKVDRLEGRDMYSQGPAFRPPSTKKMTCLLAKPFVYPEEPENLDAWEHDEYWKSMKSMVAQNREASQWGQHNPDRSHRKAIALQAQQLLKGKLKWTPTWQNFADDWRAMRGVDQDAQHPPPGGEGSRPSV
ncbi:mitochondrial 54S ribosomal protein YmL41 [Cladophialophora chaetospira]|uniref:Large ribosomal subunit protein uL23m n=1 Tax=Cladophialophora chaetospira TaxID=386627 RepID=A0AA38X080_9EURO|nr:mitochondrial 54S ribosomal protein YmL41 [Cladophialophora chaetospira]